MDEIIAAIAGALVTALAGYIVWKLKDREHARRDRRNAEEKRRTVELAQFLALPAPLAESRVAFHQQLALRKRLRVLLARSGAITSDDHGLNSPELFRKKYVDMNDEEKALHGFIRSITYGSLGDANRRMRDAIRESYSTYEASVADIGKLQGHLNLWLDKAVASEDDDSVCLVYVGTNDGFPFPTDVEEQIFAHLRDLREALPQNGSREVVHVAG